MATRKDLLKAQSFISRRMVAAFVDRDPNDPTPPLRRIGTASFVSVLLGVILLAGTALIGMLKPGGGTAWQEEGIIISDTSAGMLFVYAEESLWPMADVTSARLQAAGKDALGPPRVVKVATEKLKGTPQQSMQGIPRAPRQLPAAADMQTAPLRLCSSAPNGAGRRFVSLEFASAEGRDVDDEVPTIGSDEPMAFVAQASSNKQYLISNGKSHALWSRQNLPSPLTQDLPVVEPGDLWLTALPEGAPVEPVEIPEFGKTPANNILKMRVGDLAEVQSNEGAPSRYYIQLDGGLTRLSYLDMSLIQETKELPTPRKISETNLALGLNPNQDRFGNNDVILDKPQPPVDYPSLKKMSVCATYTGEDSGRVVFSVGKDTPQMDKKHLQPYENRIDLVDIDPLNGALLQNARIASDDPTTSLVLNGLRYSIPDKASRSALGYRDVPPVKVPGQLISLIPEGLNPGANLSLDYITQVD